MMTTQLSAVGPQGCLEAFRRYRDGAGLLTAYVSPTMHASLHMLARMGTELPLPEPEAVDSLAEQVPTLEPDQLLVLELPAAQGLRTALDLAATRGLWPILTSRLRFHPHGYFGDAPTAALLLLRAPQVVERRGWCLVVDRDRRPAISVAADAYDNRHEFRLGDLPSGEDLRAVGIRLIHCFTAQPDDNGEMAEDLNQWLAQVTRYRIGVTFSSPTSNFPAPHWRVQSHE